MIYAARGKWISAEEGFLDAFARDDNDPPPASRMECCCWEAWASVQRYLESSLESLRLAPAWVGATINAAVAYTIRGSSGGVRKFADLGLSLGMTRRWGPVADILRSWRCARAATRRRRNCIVAALPPGMAADGGAETIRQSISGVARWAPRPAHRSLRSALCVPGSGARDDATHEAALHDLVHHARRSRSGVRHCRRIAGSLCKSGTIGTAWAFLWLPECCRSGRTRAFNRCAGAWGCSSTGTSTARRTIASCAAAS